MSTATRLALLGFLVAGLTSPAAAHAELQIIHNAADPAAAVVDVYVNGTLTIDDFAFRTATGFLDLPANTDLDIAIAPGTSTSAADALFTQTFNLPDGFHQLIANGVLDPAQFAANPDGVSIAFELLTATAVKAAAAGEVAVRVVHGATDAPTVDVRSDGAILVDDAAYTNITGYLALAPADYVLDITTAAGAAVASFQADLSGAAGAAVTVLASGFLSPADDQNGPAFGLLAVFVDGTTALLPAAPAPARLQVIHNAADPAAAVVDVYVNDALLLDDFAFRTATPFIDVPANTELTVAVAPGTSASAADAVFSQAYTLPAGSTTQLIANGVLDPAQFEANPDGVSTAFQLLVGADAQEAASNPAEVDVRVVHGATDAPTVDVRSGGAILVDDAAYTDVTGYLMLVPAAYTLDITTAAGGAVASFQADLSGAAGAAVTVLASGFLSPANDQNGPAFGLLAVFADGITALLPTGAVAVDDVPEAGAFALGLPAPNPTVGSARVTFSLDAPGRATVAVYDLVGRRVAVLADGTFGADRVEVDLGMAGLAAGTYVLRLDAAAGTRTRTMTVLR